MYVVITTKRRKETGVAQPSVDADFLSGTELFSGTSPDEIRMMLGCLGTRSRSYRKGDTVLAEGSVTRSVGLVLEGAVRVESSDVWGNTSVMGQFSRGQTFADAYAALGDTPLLDRVVAASTPTRILFLDVVHIVGRCPRACSYHATVSANLLASVARKNVALGRRIRDAAPKSLRGKLMAYLSTQAKLAGSREFDIPFNRQQLADYLGVDRSALSSVISRLQRENVIRTNRSHFELLGAR